ncbi:type VI immunity family protein [Labrys sp. (in: a-proteobacteria)]|uniref:type VI immunity family protein n=1 Tax=Labrys sp. (in: a-proteobacteria) TaxID=1917972 RepID=UPI0039E50A9F
MEYPFDLKLNPRDIEERGVLRAGSGHAIRSRVGILLSIYFLEGWRREKRQALFENLKDYLSLFGDKITHFHPAGDGNNKRMRRYKGIIPEEFIKITTLSKTDTAYLFVKHVDMAETDDPSLYMFMAFGHEEGTRNPLSGMKVHFPPSFVFENPDRYVELVARWCDRLSAIHGSSGLGVLSRPGAEMMEDAYHYPWLMHYSGLEYDAMGDYWAECSEGGYEQPRSSNWLTILGSANIDALGGDEVMIRKKLTPDIEVRRYSGGVVLRAGKLPVLGTAETGGIPKTYQTVARFIKPIRFEGYRYNIMKLPRPMLDLDREVRLQVTLNWLRRFDQ